jgi:hypothetical protein
MYIGEADILPATQIFLTCYDIRSIITVRVQALYVSSHLWIFLLIDLIYVIHYIFFNDSFGSADHTVGWNDN